VLPRSDPGFETAAAAPAPAVAPGQSSESGTAPQADPMRLALYHHRAGDFENALIHYRAVLQKDELNAAAHNNLGMLYQQKNLLDEAAREFQRAILIDPNYRLARNNYGVALLGQGRTEAAAAEFRAVIALDPRNVDAVVNLALAEKQGHQPEKARATLLRALGMSPGHAAAHYNLAVLHDAAGDFARAIEHYRAFLETAGADDAGRAPVVRARIETLSGR